ncbi:MAG: ketose-bisphosphate aldolase [Phycisphaeraceae bacterium]
MPMVSAKKMLRDAVEGGYCVGAFNCTGLPQLKAVIDTAAKLEAPVIIQTSVSPATFFTPELWASAVRALAEQVDIPVCLHLDHCNEVDFCKRAADAGYTNIMIDASHHPFEQNIRITREVVDYCHAKGDITVEGELGTVGGVEDQVVVAEDEAQLCDPEQALDFVERSGVDLFAPAIGTAHGVYKTENPKIDFERFECTQEAVNGETFRAPLIVHGGTGLKEDVVRRLVEAGGAKFNVSTDLKYALIDATADYIAEHREDYNPGKLDKAVYQAIEARIAYWINLLGSAGKANAAVGA